MEQKRALVQVSKTFTCANLLNDGGLDVGLKDDIEIDPGQTIKALVSGHFVLKAGYRATVHPRSSTASDGLLVHCTVIDAEYCGQLFLILTNLSAGRLAYKSGSRVAQLVITEVPILDLRRCSLHEVPKAGRQERCLGSTGV